MEDNQFWVRVWSLAAAVVISITVSVLACLIHNNITMVEMVKAGATPLDAKCAVEPGGTTTVDCNILLGKK